MSADETMSQADEVMALVKLARPLFAGKRPEVQGAALADLVAIWVAGHIDQRGDDALTKRVRDKLLKMHIATVRELVPLNTALMAAQKRVA